MTNTNELVQQARAISKEERKEILVALPETDLHIYLKELFKIMQPDYAVEITHGPKELGKDLVIVKKDRMTVDVIGVVVKRGNIKSRTLGDVEDVIESVNHVLTTKLDKRFREIKSQVHQAFKHPAEMKTIFKTLPVDKVFVILAGELSNQARTRLRKEAEGNLEIFDIDWLIEQFTSYYPQVFFEGRVIDFLHTKIHELEKRNWLIKSEMNLSECFVEPLVRNIDVPIRFDSATVSIMIVQKRMPFSKLRSLITTNRRIILVGDPGTGKSASLAKLSIDMLREAYSHISKITKERKRVAVPLLITAKDVLGTEELNDLLAAYLGDTQILDRIQIQVLMIDGLDEVPSDKREWVVEKVRSFADELSCALLIASRKIDLLSTTPPGFEKYELLPFEANQALRLFEKIHGKDQVVKSLRGGLDKIRYQIPMVPLSLIMLIELVEENKEIPASVTELYERFTDIILGRYDRQKGIEVLFEYLIKKRFLAALAYSEFLNRGRLEVSKHEYDLFLERYTLEYGLEREDLERFVKEIERVGVLNVDDDGLVTFSHRNFLDYFSAFYIYDKRDEISNLDEFIVNTCFNDIWGDTAFFYTGMKREISKKLLEQIFSFEDDSISADMTKILSGRLLQAGWHSPTKTKIYGIEKAFGLAPDFRMKLIAYSKEKKWNLPTIFSDMFLLVLSDLSFRSSFLSRELKVVFDRMCEQGASIASILPVFWAMKPFISADELRTSGEKFLTAVTESTEFDSEEKARALLLMKVMERNDRVMTKAIQAKLNRLVSKNPGVFRGLLGPKQRGMRQQSSKALTKSKTFTKR